MNMRSGLLMITAVVGCFGVQSQIKADCAFNVEIYNKSSNAIKIDLVAEGRPYSKVIVSKTKWPLSLSLFSKRAGFTIYIDDNNKHYQYKIIRPRADSTIYLSWDPRKEKEGKSPLYPQTGPLEGTTSMTDSGCLKRNNVTAADIKRVP